MNELGRYPLLTAAQEVELAKRIERGDERAKEQMINSNLPPRRSTSRAGTSATACRWATSFRRASSASIAPRRSSTGARASSSPRTPRGGSAKPAQRAVANQSKTIRIPVHVDERRNKLRRARQQFEIKHGREPSVEELAEAGGMSVQHAQEALEAVEASVSLNTRLGDGDAVGDLFADRESIDPDSPPTTPFAAWRCARRSRSSRSASAA